MEAEKSPGEEEKKELRGNRSPFRQRNQEWEAEKSPGEEEKKELRGNRSPFDQRDQEWEAEKSPGEEEKKELRGNRAPFDQRDQEMEAEKSPGESMKIDLRGIVSRNRYGVMIHSQCKRSDTIVGVPWSLAFDIGTASSVVFVGTVPGDIKESPAAI